MCCSASHSRLLLFSDLDHSEGAGSESWHFLLALVLKLVLACFSNSFIRKNDTAGTHGLFMDAMLPFNHSDHHF